MLSHDERDGRWARVREQMNRAGLDCLLAYEASGDPSARYLTQVDMKGLAVFPLEREPVYLLSSGQRWLHWATDSQNWVEDVRAARDLAAATRDALEEVGARRVGLVGFKGMGNTVHGELLDALSDRKTEDASPLMHALRLVKSREELAMMEHAAGAAAQAIEALRSVARPGVREHVIYAEMFKILLAAGCEPASLISIEASPRPFHPASKPSTRLLREGDVLLAHVNPRYGGYFGHPHVCVTLGEPRADIQAMFQVCEEAFETFKANAKPGITLGEVSRKTLAVIERAGYDWVKEPLAHSIGLNQSEAPRSGVLPDPYPDFELVENQAFGLHPWVGRMADNIGIDSGRAVRITKDGAVPFGPSPNVELMVV